MTCMNPDLCAIMCTYMNSIELHVHDSCCSVYCMLVVSGSLLVGRDPAQDTAPPPRPPHPQGMSGRPIPWVLACIPVLYSHTLAMARDLYYADWAQHFVTRSVVLDARNAFSTASWHCLDSRHLLNLNLPVFRTTLDWYCIYLGHVCLLACCALHVVHGKQRISLIVWW